MAREKLSSFTADDAAVCEEERAVASAPRLHTAATKKKIPGKRSGDLTGGEQSDANAAHAPASRTGSAGSGSASGNAHGGKGGFSPSSRGNKTLGWFLNDGLFQNNSDIHSNSNKGAAQNSPSPPEPAAIAETKDTLTTNRGQGGKGVQGLQLDEDKKRGRRARQRQTKRVVDLKGAVDMRGVEEIPEGKVSVIKNDYKDDYWYYDPSTDGYYYEQMGSRGWRRRAPVSERKRIQMEQEMYTAMVRDPAGAFSHIDPYAFVNAAAMANATLFTPQVKYYDAASDGYYFEMPSVDGWKKRQPNSNSNSSSGMSSNSSSYKSASSVPNFARAVLARHEGTSYGAALARGQMPPACMVASSISASNQDPFSSGASSLSTLSSLSAGTPTPPPQNSTERGTIFGDEDSFDDLLSEQYDRALELEELLNDGCDNDHFDDNREVAPLRLSSNVLRKAQPVTYADVAASATFAFDCGNNKTPNKGLQFKRPGTLQLITPIEDPLIGQVEKENNRDGHEFLLNFNVDKFIADLAFCGTNPEGVLHDLAALKTPVAATTHPCSMDSPRSPATNLDGYRDWSRPVASSHIFADDWCHSDFNDGYIDEIWSKEAATPIAAKSKLSIWRDSGLFAGVPIDNS